MNGGMSRSEERAAPTPTVHRLCALGVSYHSEVPKKGKVDGFWNVLEH
jgi:hypothetical protein